jgi:hypothetical protein
MQNRHRGGPIAQEVLHRVSPEDVAHRGQRNVETI